MVIPGLAAVGRVVVRKTAGIVVRKTAAVCARVDHNILIFYLVVCIKDEGIRRLVNTTARAFPQQKHHIIIHNRLRIQGGKVGKD